MRLNNLGDFATFRGRVFFSELKENVSKSLANGCTPRWPTRQLSLATKNTSWKWPPIPAAESRRFWGKRSFFDLLKDGNPWELCPWELVAANGLNGRRRKTGLDCLKTQNSKWYHVAGLPLCGHHDKVPNNRIYRMVFFQDNPQSMNSKHLKNKSRVTTHKSTSFQPLPTISLALDAWVLFPYSRTAACCGDRGEGSASSRNGLVKLDLMVYHFQPTNLSYGSCVLFLGVGKGNHFDYTFNEFQW